MHVTAHLTIVMHAVGGQMGECPINETFLATPESKDQVVCSALANATHLRDDPARPCTETGVKALVTIHKRQ